MKLWQPFMRRFWAWPSELKRLGVLGMNQRNADFVLPLNPRANFPNVDDKLRTKTLCEESGIRVPTTLEVLRCLSELKRLPGLLETQPEFVIKPARGSGGRGIIVIAGRKGQRLLTPGGTEYTEADLRYHCAEIMSGLYSLGGVNDAVIVEQRIVCHTAFDRFAVGGTPDIRVIVYRGEPAMAMARLTTQASKGKANLHQGAVAAAIDLKSGAAHGGVFRNRFVAHHPDTKASLSDLVVPHWPNVLEFSCRLANRLGLGYVGIDLVIDQDGRPLVLEANARPGLAIQLANRTGLVESIQRIDAAALREQIRILPNSRIVG